jgi:hypothetical protein
MLLVSLLELALSTLPTPQCRDYFTIRIVDDQTGRGVPLVELRTTNDVAYYSDSNGIVAFYEPGLMGQTVYFNIKSDGYEFPEDFLGNRGIALNVNGGGSAEVKIKRISIAERLYRVTGEGIYRDSVLVGARVPLKQPVLNAQVMGQDGGPAIPYRGKLFWFWGDTAKPSYPLGNLGTSGATSEWPGKGGLDPNVGIDLAYFVDESGFSRPMLPSADFPGPGPKWIGGLKIISDEGGGERLVADYARIKDLGEAYERGLAIYNDKTETFERLVQFDLDDPMFSSCWGGHPVPVNVSGIEYYYQNYVPPFLCRVRADMAHLKDPTSYEGFSPLVAGTRYEKAATRLDRSPDAHLRYAWKQNTPPLTPSEEQELIAAGKMKASEGVFQLRNVDTDARVKPHAGSIQWNSFRQRWVMIVKEDEGLANHGSIWFAEADTPLGPWVYAKRVLRHDKYNFYNPVHHAFFDQNGSRLIFFEGTYSDFFAAGGPITPRYNYNQIMYRLALDDPRLALPVPVYQTRGPHSSTRYLLRDDMDAESAWGSIETVPFFAIPPRGNHDGLIPIFAAINERGMILNSHAFSEAGSSSPIFYALPASPARPQNPQGPSGKWSCMATLADGSDYASFALDLKLEGEQVRSAGAEGTESVQGTFKGEHLHLILKTTDETYTLDGELQQGKLRGTWQSQNKVSEHGDWHCERPPTVRQLESPAIVPLYEYTRLADGSCLYSTDPALSDQTLKRSPVPLCRVWRNPTSHLILDLNAKPVPVSPPKLPPSSDPALDSPEYRAVQQRLAQGWNTWDVRSVITHVLLPSGLAVRLGLQHRSTEGSDAFLSEARMGRLSAGAEQIFPGEHAWDGSYTSLRLSWGGNSMRIQSAHAGDDLVLLITPLPSEHPAPLPALAVLSVGFLWNNAGSASRVQAHIETESPSGRISIYFTGRESRYVGAPIASPYFSAEVSQPIALSTGRPRSLAEIEAILHRQRRRYQQSIASAGTSASVVDAIQTTLGWNTIYDPEYHRVISPVGRNWSVAWGGYVVFEWDTFFAAALAATGDRELAYANAIETLRGETPEGLIPNYTHAGDHKTSDRSEPPVGAITLLALYRQFHDRWLLEDTFGPLLRWNRWWAARRDIQGYLTWGSNGENPPSDLGDSSRGTRQGAIYESGLDNSPMYDAAQYDPSTGSLQFADVGLMSLYIADCDALAAIATTLGKSAEAAELEQRASRYRAKLGTLWSDQTGIFLNKDLHTGEFSRRLSPTNFYPLLAHAATPQQADRMIKEHLLNEKEFWGRMEYLGRAQRHHARPAAFGTRRSPRLAA